MLHRRGCNLSFSGLAAPAPGFKSPGPLSHSKDALLRGHLDVLSRGCGTGHLLRVGELGQEPQAEVFPPLILLPPVDEDFVLQVKRQVESQPANSQHRSADRSSLPPDLNPLGHQARCRQSH